ncbi:MAG: hypothetical protein NVS9B3_04790 [Gemmatimonadaceae bacterium]
MFDPAEAIDAVGFVWRALRGHTVLAASVFAAIVAVGVLASLILPRHYVIATKMLADKNVVMPALIERRAQSSEADAPTRLATEAVLNRENLLGIVRETRLLDAWPVIRSPLGRARDRVMQLIRGASPEEARLDALVDLVRGRLSVETSEGTVTILLDWMDAATGYRIVQAAQQHFFDQRRASEVAMIEESIRILEGHVASAQQAIQDVLATMPRSAVAAAASSALAARPTPRARPNAAEVTMLAAALQAKVQTITGLETAKNERLSALQSRMAELRNNLGPAHPDILTLQENIKAMNADSPRLRDLRAEEAALRARLAALGGPLETPSAAGADPTSAVVAGLLRGRAESIEPPDQLYAKSRLKIATNVYEDLLERLEGARLSLETAGAAFKYRYTIITPPELPRFPTKPNVLVLIVGTFLLALALAVFAAVALDVAAGKILQSWQVRRQLKLPVLAEVPAA